MNTVTDSDIIEVEITPQMKARILAKSEKQGVLNHRTLVAGEGNIGGFAGEEIVMAYLPFLRKTTESNTRELYNFDFELPNGRRLEIKSKGNNKRKPLTNYDCTVPVNQKSQKTDFYVFTRISADLTRGWICGIIPKKNFLNIASIRKNGQAYNNAGRKSVEDHFVCTIDKLFPISVISHFYEANPDLQKNKS